MSVAGSAADTTGSPGLPATGSSAAGRRGVAADEARFLRGIVALCGRLSALATQEVDLSAVARLLADGVGAQVALLDRAFDVLAFAGVDDPEQILNRLRGRGAGSGPYPILAAAARTRRALTVPVLSGTSESVIVAPVSVGQDVAGYLLTASGRAEDVAEDMRLLVTEHAAMVCGVLLGRDLVVAAAAGRARQELFEGLLHARDRDDGELDRWARHLGFDPAREHHVLALAFARGPAADALSSAESLLARLALEAIVAARPDEIVAIMPVRGRDGLAEARSLAAACVAAIGERRLGTAAIGIGNPCRAAAEISRSYQEASRALAATLRMGGSGGVTAFADLGIHRLLLRVPDVADLRAFAHEVLGRLVEEEQATGMAYLATLSAYFNSGSSPRRTAERLHVHPNTVSYRIRRIEEITGLCFDVHRDRLMAEVAVEILDGLGET